MEKKSFRLKKEGRVIFPFYRQQKPFSIKPKKGVVKVNFHLSVLFRKLAEGKACRKGITVENKNPYRPKLLLKNHANPRLQLWACEGCKEFLLRAKVAND